MAVTSALVLLAVTWFMVMFVVLPIGLRTQGDVGEKVAGTHAGAPADFRLKPVLVKVTLIALVIWAIEVAVILSGIITVRDLDWFGRMNPPAAAQE